MTEAVRTVRKDRPHWHYPYKHECGRILRKDAADVVEIQLLRHVEDDPRARLIVHAIWQALQDALNPQYDIPKYLYHDSFEFFRDGRMDEWAELVGLEPDFVRKLIRQAVGEEVL